MGETIKEFVEIEKEVVLTLIKFRDSMDNVANAIQDTNFKFQIVLKRKEFNYKQVSAKISANVNNVILKISDTDKLFGGINSLAAKIAHKTKIGSRDKILKLQSSIMDSTEVSTQKLLGIVNDVNKEVADEAPAKAAPKRRAPAKKAAAKGSK